jgi:GNAT superfamily N-acetyltransferase
MSVVIRELSEDDLALRADLYPLLAVLRPGLSPEAFDMLMSEGAAQGLRTLIAQDGQDRCVGAALYRVLATSRGRVVFLDDLVTDPEIRSQGVGAELLAEVERRGRAAGCERIELDSGVTNQAAHRFYHRHRLGILALHFAKELDRS